MKKIFLLLLISVQSVIYSQYIPEKENQIYDVRGLTIKPEFPDGLEKLNLYIVDNLNNAGFKLPAKSKIFAMFTIEKDGSLTDVKIAGSTSSTLAAELVKIIKNLPKWNPGRQNSTIVRVKYVLTITTE